MSPYFDRGNATAFPLPLTPKNEISMKSKIALILMALACAFAAVPAHAEEEFNPTPQQVREWRAAAERGDAEAQKELGRCYYYGKEVEKDLREAVHWCRKAAEQGLAAAQYKLGICYDTGEGVAKDSREAARWYRKAAEQGYADAQYNLGVCYRDGEGVEKDSREAVRWFRKAAEQGDAQAQHNLGSCYAFGEGVEKELREAVRWWRKSAEQGLAQAQFNLGVCYESGKGVEKASREAVRWYRKAAEQGLAEAQFNLGNSYLNGEGVEKDIREAVRWFRKAADQGDAEAQCNLGVCYGEGNGVEKDSREAVRWYRKAAEQGLAKAQCVLGACYVTGNGVEKDLFEAWHWFSLAADQGDSNAKEILALELFSDRSKFGVDAYIPSGKRRRGDVFVCVVANEDYSDVGVDKVPHAVNDGKVFAEYARKTLGVPARNVKVVTNATVGKMMAAEDWLAEAVRVYPDAEVVFYYAGHGVPVIENGKITRKCLLPTDISPGRAERSAVDVDAFLARLSRLGAKQVTVFLDACFSGTLEKGVRLARAAPDPVEACGKMVVFSAASGDQTAQALDSENHGLFTYCLLRKLQDTKGEVTWRELGEHLTRRVPQLAHENGLSVRQKPTMRVSGGFDLDRKLTE